MIGPGKYDDLCTYVRARAKADGVIVIVLNGEKGQGFSAQLPVIVDGATIARILRDVADEIERSYPKAGRA